MDAATETGIGVTAVVGVARRLLQVVHRRPARKSSMEVRRPGLCASSNSQRPSRPWPSAETPFLIMSILSMV